MTSSSGSSPKLAEVLLDVLTQARSSVADLLALLAPRDVDAFWLRVHEHLGDALGPLDALYGRSHDVSALALELIRRAALAAGARSEELRGLDHDREIRPDWFQRPSMIGYVAYAERFAGTLNGVADRIDYLCELDVSYLHLMSVIRPRQGANDGGFAVADYRSVDPALGTMDDLASLAALLRAQSISLCVDLVMNHTAAEHEWAQRARAGEQHFRDFYLIYPDRTIPDQWERTLPQVFPELAPGNFTWDDGVKGWVWTTFNTFQWDLNYANPDVLVEMFDNMAFLANQGVEVLRLDAVAFTWKRMGTDCQNQPEAHLIVQVLRACLAMAAPATICKAEAIVGPDELVPYLGAHDVVRRECELAYNNQLMVMLWSSVATRDVGLMTHAMSRMKTPPSTTAWCTYIRCHDDIGWAITDQDAAAAMVGGASHRQFLTRFFRGDFPLSYARGAAFSSNPLNGDERTCGTAAALSGIDDARMRADEHALDLGIRRLLLLYGVILGFGGVPLLYMGDELALPNDTTYLADPEKAGDSRWMHRPLMDWQRAQRRRDLSSVEGRVFSGFTALIGARKTIPAIHAAGTVEWIWAGDPRVAAFVRRHPSGGKVMVLANVSEFDVAIDPHIAERFGFVHPVDQLAPEEELIADGALRLGPLGVRWLVDSTDGGVHPAVMPVTSVSPTDGVATVPAIH